MKQIRFILISLGNLSKGAAENERLLSFLIRGEAISDLF